MTDLSDPIKRLAYAGAGGAGRSARWCVIRDGGKDNVMADQQEMATEIVVAMLETYPVDQVAEWGLNPDKFRAWVIETHKMIADAVKAEWPIQRGSVKVTGGRNR